MRRSWLALALSLTPLLARAQGLAEQKELLPPLWSPPYAQSFRPEGEKKARDQFRVNTANNGLGGGGGGGGTKFGQRLFGPPGKDLDAYGNWVLTLRDSRVSGSAGGKQWFNNTYNTQFFNTTKLGPFQQQLDITMLGRLFGVFNVNTSLTNNRIASQTSLAQLLGFEYSNANKTTKAAFGDVNANLPGNELVTFSRRLVGVQLDRQLGGGKSLSTVASITRALTRRGTLQGQGTTGPYYLNASQIVPGSERIYLNGQLLTSYEDYELDYILGTVRFKKSRIINREDTVEFTYESQAYNTTAGILTGLRYDTPAALGQGKNGRVGVTLLRQNALGGSASGRPITQYYPVSSDISARYTLPSPIQANSPVEVRYQQTVLTEGVNADYILNRDLNFVQLRRAFPADTSLTGNISLAITYTPAPQQGVGGDRDVLGVDSQFSPTRTSQVNVQYGQSRGITRTTTGTGLILSATLGSSAESVQPKPMLDRGEDLPVVTRRAPGSPATWSASLGWRNIEPGFTSIESTAAALLRAEKGLRGNFSYSPSPSWNYGLMLSDSAITSQSTSTTTPTTPAATPTTFKSRSMNFSAGWNPNVNGGSRLPTVRYARSDTQQGSGENLATFTSDQLTATYNLNRGTVESNFSRTASKGRSIFAFGYTGTVGTGASSSGGFLGGFRDGTTGQTTTNSASESAQLRLNLTPSARLSLASSIGLTRNKLSGGSYSGRDTSFAVTYSPVPEKLQLELTLTDTSNGQSLAGFYNPNSSTSGGSGTVLGGSSTGQRTRLQSLRANFTPTNRLEMKAEWSSTLSLIPNYDNTESTLTDFSASYAWSPKIRLDGQWSQQAITYTGNQGDSDNQNYTVNATLGPFKRMNFTLTGARLNYGSAFASLGTGGIGSGLGGIGSGLNSGFGQQGLTNTFALRSTYQVARTQPFLEWRLLDASSPETESSTPNTNGAFHSSLNYRNIETRIGVDWGLTDLLGASLNVRLINVKDRDNPQFSYRATMFNFDIKARFN